VLAFFANEDAAYEAAMALKKWEKASEYMKVDRSACSPRTRAARSSSTSSGSRPASEA
jgi:hypothetical protein